MGAEYCPYCAAERWAMAVALSRFGTFSDLRLIHSSSADIYPNTPTLSFYRSSYASTSSLHSGGDVRPQGQRRHVAEADGR